MPPTPIEIPPASPFQRRYQVFVSSTYEDLKEERRHVIQALLESKCIPAGMELFPAASIEQWELIKRVIDESDYYVVIVAGRYGSRSSNGLSYTEMEFDYAMESGKPVMGFYHAKVLDLPGTKLERTDAGKRLLAKFTSKVKSRLCRPWLSAEALGSAIKSAVFSEIEFNPQPGWVRATSQADPSLILKLKQRIADLESQVSESKLRSRRHAPTIDEIISVDFEIKFKAKQPHEENKRRYDTQMLATTVQVSWPAIFTPLGIKLKEFRTQTEIVTILKNAAVKASSLDAENFCPAGFELESVRLAKSFAGQILDKLLADKLIVEQISNSDRSWSRKKIHKFRLTQKGLQFAAALRSQAFD